MLYSNMIYMMSPDYETHMLLNVAWHIVHMEHYRRAVHMEHYTGTTYYTDIHERPSKPELSHLLVYKFLMVQIM